MHLRYDIEPDRGGQYRGEGKRGRCLWKTDGQRLLQDRTHRHSPPDEDRTLTVGLEAMVVGEFAEILLHTTARNLRARGLGFCRRTVQLAVAKQEQIIDRVGSVGQPKTGKPRRSSILIQYVYCILDPVSISLQPVSPST